MKSRLEFGLMLLMLERSDTFWVTRPVWRCYSGKLHGPFMFTRRSAFLAWVGARFFGQRSFK